ncbi:MAG: guanylate kinase [Thermovenabulum sp.]|uniref:guanylate kinase n=1 Tax=Thermovenabulum sp. TaxID=3100335 RepID=UPI003C7A23A9
MGKKGMLIVLSGPSGAGKGTVCSRLLEKNPNIALSISYTTRTPRPGEKDGVNYFFTDKETFEKMIKEGCFLEWANVYNNYYGTPRKFVEERINNGQDVILEIDIQGAKQIRQTWEDAVFIFILPPDLEELKRRIEKRGSETEESMRLRLMCALEELKALSSYDYVIVNDDLEKAVEKLQAIIIAEKCRVYRNPDIIEKMH